MPRGDLFPEIGPFETGYLPLSAGHVMYWEQVGNPRGRPVLFLHGGPGAGAGAVHRRFFDPDFWRVIIFDQRGAGRSRPLGSLDGQHHPGPGRRHRSPAPASRRRALVAVRRLLGLDTGAGLRPGAIPTGSPAACCAASSSAGRRRWTGSCTACARCSPKRTRRSPVSCRKRSAATCWRLLGRLTDPDPAVHMPAARAWSIYEGPAGPCCPARKLSALRAGPHRAGAGAHRGVLFRQRSVPAARRIARRHGSHRPHPGRDRAGPLRHDLPGLHRVRAGGGLAERKADHRAGCGPFRAGAGHPARALSRQWNAIPGALSAAGHGGTERQ